MSDGDSGFVFVDRETMSVGDNGAGLLKSNAAMTREQPQIHPKPYDWDDAAPPPQETLRLWTEVGNGIDKSQTVVWKSALESLDQANKFLRSSEDARTFVEKYMGPIISILVEQQPTKIGLHERYCVQESLALAVLIIVKDLTIQLSRRGECAVLNVLSFVFNKKKACYKGNKVNWNVNHMSGLPEVRLKMIDNFRNEKGFALLRDYMAERINTPLFPTLKLLHHILQALGDTVPNRTPGAGQVGKQMEDDAIEVAGAVMNYINESTDDVLKKLPTDQLSTVRHDLQRIFDRLVSTRRASTYEFYKFWRALALKLITSRSLPLKLFGWEQVNELIEACTEHRPPPRSFMVTGAGCTFVNGIYNFAASTTEDGYSQRGVELTYERRIPDAAEEGAGKKLTLFRCTMRSQQKWWFLSEADEEQPGTDRDIDYYQHKSKEHEETLPPPSGWVTCRNAGVDPSPNLQARGLMVPPGEEFNTLDHQLARWAIENGIIEKVLGDSIHREVVARSTALIKFLASMCERDQPQETTEEVSQANQFCLTTQHLLLAWKTCTRKADAAVSAQVYQLLVSILPSCPGSLAIPLLKAIQASLEQTEERRDYLQEVADFCSALASANPVDVKSGTAMILAEDVRAEVLELLWAVLTHPEASSLKSYENLKRFVTYELRVEPKGSEHRLRFMKSCIDSISLSARKRSMSAAEEVQALRMVKLTHFVLESCPREQANRIVADNQGALPVIIFSEITAFLERRKSTSAPGIVKKQHSSVGDLKQEISPLSERLRILRCVYGLSDEILLNSSQLQNLWKLCSAPTDREELMVFIASASGNGLTSNARNSVLNNSPMQPNQATQSDDVLTAAFSEEIGSAAFRDLFCSQSVSYELLGEGGYSSFQYMFKKFSPSAYQMSRGAALDALWRICLLAGNESVASQAMKDLLSVYISMTPTNIGDNGWADRVAGTPSDQMQTDDEESFGKRVFDCLASVKKGLESGDASAERSAQRCLRILNAAVGQSGDGGSSMTSSTLARLSLLSPDSSLKNALETLPHGMRGQACYRRVGVMARPTSLHSQPGQASQVYQVREEPTSFGGSNPPRNSSTMRFSIDVHPLETLASVKAKVALYCGCVPTSIKLTSVNGRMAGAGRRQAAGESSQMNLGASSDDTVMDEMGVVQGCEMVFGIANQPLPTNTGGASMRNARANIARGLSDIFCRDDDNFADSLFEMLLGVMQYLPRKDPEEMSDPAPKIDSHGLVWDLLLAMPTNKSVAARVRKAASFDATAASNLSDDDAMDVDTPQESWSSLLDHRNFHRTVYVLLSLDAFLQPAVEVLSVLSAEQRIPFERDMQANAVAFRRGFIETGGFDAVVNFFSTPHVNSGMGQSNARMGNAVALRILKCCLFGNSRPTRVGDGSPLDEAGARLQRSLSNADGLLKSLTAMVVEDPGISASTVSDVLKFLRLLFHSPQTAQDFVLLPEGMAEKFLITLLMWEGGQEITRASSAIGAAAKVRKNTHDLILSTPTLANRALPWLISAIDTIEVTSESTSDYFDVLQKLVSRDASENELRDLGTAVCKKLSSCPRPTNDAALIDFSTGVLCGCLALLRALVENGGGAVLRPGTNALVQNLGVSRWSEMVGGTNKGVLALVSSSFRSREQTDDSILIDLMGTIFDGFLSPGGSSSVVSICCDKESRQRGFDVVGAAARSCQGGDGYMALVARINGLVTNAAPFLRHHWGHVGVAGEGHSRSIRNTSKYSGLRNQGCTCYMNSVLQQLFMMPELRKTLCLAPLPACLRSTGGVISAKGNELVGKKVAMQWDSGGSFDAAVEAFDPGTGMHTIRYCPIHVATLGGSGHPQVQPEDIGRLPPSLPDELFLSEGRPGKETGVFEVVSNGSVSAMELSNDGRHGGGSGIEETEDEASSRHLLEEVQRTFIHLDEGSRGRCFDPRALVEACGCLKLEFDVWQQNDASEFATKLLDRLEISLKRWAPSHFRYLDHTFGLEQTKQKICKECGLKTNRKEKLLNIDCQIRGKADIHEALASMTEVEIMEGSNKVFCDRCKKNTDTVLRTAISVLPNMLILSLKRFDLDYNTFETVKLNSRCAFGQTLNMKQYTLEGLEEMEKNKDTEDSSPSPMDTGDCSVDTGAAADAVDDNYEYRLAGVLVHAGVAQGGHYYSFIKDRNPESEDKWYRFDDEDVTPFDPASIEVECFGGKVKKETKWPNGQVHTVESEQYANALMLFYEKVKPTDAPSDANKNDDKDAAAKAVKKSSGYEVFEPDVRRSNATHRWQTFLFDAEFQTFLKGLLGLCRLSSTDREKSAPQTGIQSIPMDDYRHSWHSAVVQMLLSFVFEILLYSAEKLSLDDWVRMLEETLTGDRQSAQILALKLARKTKEVGGNWLRTYLLECPDQTSRLAAARIFSAAIQSCACIKEEAHALNAWAVSFKDQTSEIILRLRKGRASVMPCGLEKEYRGREDMDNPAESGASSIGVIISFLSHMLEAISRYWRYSPELCLFIRNMARMITPFGGIIREAMAEGMIPARLVCLVVRDRAPPMLRVAFPGASVPMEVAETQMRPESTASSHMVPLSGNQVLNPSDLGGRGGPPLASDMLTLYEALGCMLCLDGAVYERLYVESEESPRGRPRVSLSEPAIQALTTIFEESCAPSSVGMGQREIEMYLQRCGVDSASVPTQKIVDMMSKYPTTSSGNGSKGNSYLSLEGFLAYYRDTVQTNEARVRLDLHTFGFRPDLSRRSHESRVLVVAGRERIRSSVESVAMDVAACIKRTNKQVQLGFLADIGLTSFQFWVCAYQTSEILAEMILAAFAYKRDTKTLLLTTLKSIYQAPTNWAGTDTLSTALMVLRILAVVPDELQKDRISLMMQSTDKAGHHADHAVGLLEAARTFYGTRPSSHYSSEINYAFDRYVGILKELMGLQSIYMWMHDHRTLWTWMERDLMDNHVVQHQNHLRNDFHGRRDVEGAIPVEHHPHSESDVPVVDGSDDDEEDDSLGQTDGLQAPPKIIISCAGQPAVNGEYGYSGTFENACKYTMRGQFKNETCVFTLFQCSVSNDTKHWYISIVPSNGTPGTSTDIDFYSAPVTEECRELPPLRGWTKSNEGQLPPPQLTYPDSRVEEDRGRVDQTWNSSGGGHTDDDRNRIHI